MISLSDHASDGIVWSKLTPLVSAYLQTMSCRQMAGPEADLFAHSEDDTVSTGWNFNPAYARRGYANKVNSEFSHPVKPTDNSFIVAFYMQV